MANNKFLDDSGLSHLLVKLKEIFSLKSHTHTKSDVGLGNVDNTADSAKSVKYATSSGSSTKATQDSAGQQINTTYIKSLSVNGRTVTYTKGDGITGTFQTQDTNTWRGIQDNLTSSSATDSLSAKQGKWLNDNKAEIREWNTPVKCATWSRLCYVAARESVLGNSFILNVAGTRNCVVYNNTFVIKATHLQKALISKISGSTYGSNIQLRVVSDSTGNCYVEVYDNVNNSTNTTTQDVKCSLIDIACGAVTTYTAFTDGSTLPSNFTVNASLTTNSNSLQGNLTWGEITSKPSFAAVATSGSYNDLSNRPTIGNATVTITQGGKTKGTFTLNQTDNSTIALTDTTYADATQSAHGLLSATDKKKLDGIATGANNYSHPNSGVTAGTYKSVTVNAQGHVIAGTNPTTIAGYGITDAYTKTQTDNKIATAVANAGHLKRTIVDALPAVDSADVNTIYMVAKASGAVGSSDTNGYDEYMLIVSGNTKKFEKIGDSAVDLTNYATKTEATNTANTAVSNAAKNYATAAQGTKADSAVQSVKIGTKEYKSGTTVTLPAYPTTLPASDVSAWAKASTKPTYTKSEVGLGNVNNTADADKSVKYATSAGSATKATQDSAGQQINTTYIKRLSVNGKVITYIKGDGTTGTITTQDTNTTYSNMTGATSSAAGKSGLVPAPAAGTQGKFLRGDGTWQTPANTTYGTGSSTSAGLTKLYTSTGTATDGTMTQAAIKTALDGKSATNHNHDSVYRKRIIASLDGDGSTQYVKICSLKVINSYINTPIEFVARERGRNLQSRISILFSSAASIDPGINSFKVCGSHNAWYIIKSATSTWDVYCAKTETYAGIAITDYTSIDGVIVTWTMTGISSLPANTTQASYGGNVAHATSADSVSWSGITDKPSTFTPSTHTHTKSQITDFPASLKNPNVINIKGAGTTVSTYDGSAVKNLDIVAGSNVTITPDAKNGKITISSKDTNTDTNVTQTAVDASDYTNWRPLIWGASNNATEGFSPSTTTAGVFASAGLSVQPSSGTIRATTFKGNLTGKATTAGTADKANSVAWGNVSGKPSTYTPSTHSHDSSTITSLDAGKITTGTIDIARLPQGALERLVIVADDTARFALTTAKVQLGDTVKVTSSGKMYYVVDESKLSSEAGYEVYTAGAATSVPWSGVTGKPSFSTVATSGSYTDLSNKPTIGNATITITQGGTTKGTFTLNQTGNATIALTDNNTWRGIQNNLTSTSTTESLSAAQGKWLHENKAAMTTLAGTENLNDITTPGLYSRGGSNTIQNKPSGVDAFGMIVTHNARGTYYTQILFSTDNASYRRYCSNGTWSSWVQEKLTDTVYTHPSYTTKTSGLYKITVDATGHVSATTAVAKADITALGIPSTNTTYSTGTASTAGITKLYTGTGTATDGSMTQNAITTALNGKAASSHTHNQYYDSTISRTANTVLAAPNGSNGGASFRKLVAADIPILSYLPLSGGTVTGVTSFTNTTASTSKATGALKVSGGVGVAGRMSANEVSIGDGCTLQFDSTSKTLNFVFS